MERNYRKSPFDGKKALIKGSHIYAGIVAECVGMDYAMNNPGLIFYNEEIGEDFFVFEPKHVQWLTSSFEPVAHP